MTSLRLLASEPFVPVYTNDNDAYIPEVWAQESLMILEANMVAANLVHRDFSDEIAQFGDTVNTRRPARFTAIRKLDTDDVTIQDASSVNVAIHLNQHFHTSFIIKDGEESKGFMNLRNVYLQPALLSIAEAIDAMILQQVYTFMANTAGKIGTPLDKTTMIEAREKLNNQKCPMSGRNLVVGAAGEADLLAVGDFTTADKIGDDGSTMREGSLGSRFGFQIFMDQFSPSVPQLSTQYRTGAVNNTEGYAVGDTVVAVNGITGAIVAGSWVLVAGDMTPQLVLATAGGATPSSMTLWPGLRTAAVDDAVVKVFYPGAVNNTEGFGTHWGRNIVTDGFNSIAPASGQMISTGVTAATLQMYGALGVPTATSVVLNRGLEGNVVDDAVLGLGPYGNFGLAFHRNAIAFVSRPLATPAPGTGALSAVANYNSLGIRVTITYEGRGQGHLVTVDLLCGIKTLDTDLGVVVLS